MYSRGRTQILCYIYGRDRRVFINFPLSHSIHVLYMNIYDIFTVCIFTLPTFSWLTFMVHVGEYPIHGPYLEDYPS